MTTKLKIDLNEGILEVEGSETFVKMIYNDFKLYFTQDTKIVPLPKQITKPTPIQTSAPRAKVKSKAASNIQVKANDSPPPPLPTVDSKTETPDPIEGEDSVESKSKSKPAKSKGVDSIPSYDLVNDLNLAGSKNYPSLVEFTDSKFPITNEERNLVFLYYLQDIRKIDNININHIYTCYKAVHIRAPLSIENSLQTTAQQYGWIDISKNGKVHVTTKGVEYVERQLPKKVK